MTASTLETSNARLAASPLTTDGALASALVMEVLTAPEFTPQHGGNCGHHEAADQIYMDVGEEAEVHIATPIHDVTHFC